MIGGGEHERERGQRYTLLYLSIVVHKKYIIDEARNTFWEERNTFFDIGEDQCFSFLIEVSSFPEIDCTLTYLVF